MECGQCINRSTIQMIKNLSKAEAVFGNFVHEYVVTIFNMMFLSYVRNIQQTTICQQGSELFKSILCWQWKTMSRCKVGENVCRIVGWFQEALTVLHSSVCFMCWRWLLRVFWWSLFRQLFRTSPVSVKIFFSYIIKKVVKSYCK